MINSTISKLGENIKLRRYFKIAKKIIYMDILITIKLSSIVELKDPDEDLAKDICMQIVASNPLAIDEASLIQK